MKRLITPILLLSLALFTGCDSGVGPQGPPGPEGPPGFIGATVFTANFSAGDITLDANDGALAYADFDVPELTAEVVDNGLVLAYIDSKALDQWVALPFTIAYDDNQNGSDLNVNEVVQVTYAYTYDLFSVVFTSSFNPIDLDGLPEGPVKVVLIPGALVNKVKGKNLKNATEVLNALNITL